MPVHATPAFSHATAFPAASAPPPTVDAGPGNVLHDIAAQWVDRYLRSMGQFSSFALADARLLALCAYEFEDKAQAEPDAKTMAIQFLTRPPFQDEPALVPTLVDFLMTREHRVATAAVVLERHGSCDDATALLRVVHDGADEGEASDDAGARRHAGLDLMGASYERTLTATGLLDGPDRRDSIAAKANSVRNAARRIPSELILESVDGPESFLPSWQVNPAPRTSCSNVVKLLEEDLQPVLSAEPTDLLLDMPPAIMCFLERYHYVLDVICRVLAAETPRLEIAAAERMKSLRGLIRQVLPPPYLVQFDRVLANLQNGHRANARKSLQSLESLLNSQRPEVYTLYSRLLGNGLTMPPKPRTWSGVHGIECAVSLWKTDDNPPARWNVFRWEPGAAQFTRILVELAKKPTECFASLCSPVFEALPKLPGNRELREQVFKKATEVCDPNTPVQAWIRLRQCIDEFEIGKGVYDIQANTSGYRPRPPRRLMDIVEEDFRNVQRERSTTAAGQVETQARGAQDLPADFPSYVWRESTLFSTFVHRMVEKHLSHQGVVGGLLSQGMSMDLARRLWETTP
ncbi:MULTISPECIES: hypothetical protein [unclassified Achromobacter]|uniref:hypothetical protein n=1 Tax=unclassified Achromobacter TaxID=2626865 RepID=UPI0011783FDC|nr:MULTISPECIES: hypothetical protein [unclassified Achromobacter]